MTIFQRLRANAFVQLIIELIAAFIILTLGSIIVGALHLPIYPSHDHDLAAQLVGTLLVLGVLIVAARYLERRSLAAIGLGRANAIRDLALGFLGGAALISLIVGCLAVVGWYHVTGVTPMGQIPGLLLTWAIFLLGAAILEEVLFRGILFRLLEQGAGTWIALAVSAVLFGFSHVTTPHATLFGAVAIAIEAGITFAALYVVTRSLWPVFGLHWGWNFFEGTVFGTQVSGNNDVATVLHPVVSGPTWLTGGAFGPEAGLLALLPATAIGIYLLVRAVHRGDIVMPGWLRRQARTPVRSLA